MGYPKDRQIVHKDPHQLIEGMLCSAYAIQLSLHSSISEGSFLKDIKFWSARLRKRGLKLFGR